jgi:beta-glucanase (GH16 family)
MARVIGAPGACAGIFTYLPNDDPQKVQEADIEILTKDPRYAVQYTNQPSNDENGDEIPQATVNASDPSSRAWTLWNTFRVDWTPGLTTWYVNGEVAASIAFQAPKDPTGIIMNMWGDGGLWTGPMQVYDEAYLQIQWIEMVYNTSGPYLGADTRKRDVLEKRKTPGCQAVCSVDNEVNVTGTPVLLYNNTGMATGWPREGMFELSWIPIVLVIGAGFGLL